MLGACSSSPHLGRAQLTVPQPVSAVYSEVDMRLTLVTSYDSKFKCTESECDSSQDFELQVARLGGRLAGTAFAVYPDLGERVKQFEFVIAEKIEPGTTSNATGTVVIFRGTRMLDLPDEALAFVIAREMGHVIGSHHNENTATTIIASILAQVLLPVTGLLRAFAFLPGASSAAAASATSATATTGAAIAANAATASAASFVGSRVVMASYWPNQMREADTIALNLMARTGFSPQDIADGLAASEQHMSDNKWARDLLASSGHVAQIAQGPRLDKQGLARLAGLKPLKLTHILGEPLADAINPPAELPLQPRTE